MSDILHAMNIQAAPAAVYAALATVPGLASWWTSSTSGESAVDKTIEFRFRNDHVVQMRVAELATDKRVAWECTRADPDWVGTRITFDLTADKGGTKLVFGHRAWKETNPHFAHCSMKWATFLLSLREAVEKGAGRPFPHDLQI